MDLARRLLAPHQAIERALVGARMSAMAGDAACFAAWWAHLRALLVPHIALEEELLLPIWATADAPANGTADVLRDEHRRILALLADPPTDPVARQDHLGRLAGVLEHHDAREAAGFVPGVVALLDDVGRERVLGRLTSEAPPPWPGPTRPREAPDFDDTAVGRLAAARFALATDAPVVPLEACAQALAVYEDRRVKRILGRLAGIASDDPVTRRLARIAAFDQLRLIALLLERDLLGQQIP